jgi:hypothetical protein
MRHEPEQKTVRHKPSKPKETRDPGRERGDGMKAAEGRAKDGRTEKGRPEKPRDPGRAKGDGLKAAMRDQGKRPSKVSPMKAAEMRVR